MENIDYNFRKSEIALQDIDSRVEKLNSQITYLPKTERELIGMERQFKLNDAIYTFLLQSICYLVDIFLGVSSVFVF